MSLQPPDMDPTADRARRESHNAVERRRREAINQGINDLADLLQQSGVVQVQQKMNKGTILGKAVEYIGFLQSVNQQMAEKMKETTAQQAEELQKLAQELTDLAAENEQLKLRLALRHQGGPPMISLRRPPPPPADAEGDDSRAKRPQEDAPKPRGRKRKAEPDEQ